jgi:hypothetical protein
MIVPEFVSWMNTREHEAENSDLPRVHATHDPIPDSARLRMVFQQQSVEIRGCFYGKL